jgi:hypothetical protein
MGKAVKLKLGDDFSIPAYKAGLDVLLLLAETIDEMSR